MATISASDLAALRRAIQPGDWNVTKAPVNAAVQAVEDYFETTARAGLGAAIEAVAPGLFTAAQKKRVVKMWLFYKFGVE